MHPPDLLVVRQAPLLILKDPCVCCIYLSTEECDCNRDRNRVGNNGCTLWCLPENVSLIIVLSLSW